MPQDSTWAPGHAILVLAATPQDEQALGAALSAAGEPHTVRTVQEALTALASQHYDVVVSRAADLQALARPAGSPRAEDILEHIGHGVCIIARDGQITWSNPKLNSYPPQVVERIRTSCAPLLGEIESARRGSEPPTPRRRNLDLAPEHFFELHVSPIQAPEGPVEQIAVLVWDVTATRRLREKLDAIDAAGRELVRLDAEALGEMDVGERLQLLEHKIIRYMHDLMHFDHFIVRVLDRNSGRLDTVIADGMAEEAMGLDIRAQTDGSGISGHVAATGRSYICPDVAKDPRYLPGAEKASSSLTVPLQLYDQTVGTLDIESQRIAAFSEDDRQLAEIFGRYIAIALNTLKLLAVERWATTGQLASDVASELAAPLNDIVTEATNLMEEYIGQDDLRRRLHAIIDNVDRAKRVTKSVTESSGVRGLVSLESLIDPVLDGKRILIVDDEEIIRETVTNVLSTAGALTIMAQDGDAAIAMIRSQHFDLVLSDIKMPKCSGYEVFAAVKQADADCPVILITGFGYDPNHSIVRASKEGLAGVLFKPFKVERLLEDVRQALTTNVA